MRGSCWSCWGACSCRGELMLGSHVQYVLQHSSISCSRHMTQCDMRRDGGTVHFICTFDLLCCRPFPCSICTIPVTSCSNTVLRSCCYCFALCCRWQQYHRACRCHPLMARTHPRPDRQPPHSPECSSAAAAAAAAAPPGPFWIDGAGSAGRGCWGERGWQSDTCEGEAARRAAV
jgi:hypothetical protein